MEPLEMASPTLSESSEKKTRKTDRMRPLRTYSKRTPQSDPVEPPLKRRRIDEAVQDVRPLESSRHGSKQESGCSQPSLPPCHALRDPKRGTILSYFKVVSPSSHNLSSSSIEPSSCSAEPTSTPPSSPQPKDTMKPKKRRRLTTRVMPRHLDVADEDEETEVGDKPDQPAQLIKGVGSSGVMTGTSTNTLNKVTAQSQQRSEAGKRGKKKGMNPKSATVQTTLSLSMSDQGFTECRDCNMLYNPYHAKDAKLHARRHAAMLKMKSRKGGETP